MDVRVAACAVRGVGLPDWPAAAAILAGRASYPAQGLVDPMPSMLPANERRRIPDTARWALAVGHEALEAGGRSGDDVATVLASCGSDGKITQQICEALALPAREVSPTRFHNSVHNAPAGYWSIAMGSRAPSTSLCAGRGSFGAALLEAAAQAVVEARPVLLIAYDLPYPEPLRAVWTLTEPFAIALLLEPPGERASGARMRVAVDAAPPTGVWLSALPPALAQNPSAAFLPVLALLAAGEGGDVVLPYLDRCSIRVTIAA